MFRSDRDALAGQVDDLRAENERLRQQNEAMRADLLAQRSAEAQPVTKVYKEGIAHLGKGEQAALARHSLEAFPVWATVLLHVVTFGISSFIRFNLMHDKLPKAERDDPSNAKAIGFHFIPYFNYYWVFFNALRLTDRLNLQCRLRGMPEGVSRGLVIGAAVSAVIPYVQMITAPIVFLVVAIHMQRTVNALVAHDAEQRTSAEGAAAREQSYRIPEVAELPGPHDVAQAHEDARAEAEALADLEAEAARWKQ
jgi:hypothetical protein